MYARLKENARPTSGKEAMKGDNRRGKAGRRREAGTQVRNAVWPMEVLVSESSSWHPSILFSPEAESMIPG